MADYRLDCCGGFPSHKASCPILPHEHETEVLLARKQQEDKAKWDELFDGMTDQQIYDCLEECRKQIEYAQRWVNARNRGYDYLRSRGRIAGYLDWRRNNSD